MANLENFYKFVNPNAVEVCRSLNKNGYQAYLVGGCVRDLLLGNQPKDWDIATDASPKQVINMFEKTYPTGLQHGTITVAHNEEHFEVTTFRIEGEYKDGRRPEEVFFVMNVEQDLSRRDLTINAMAYDPIAHRLVDPFDGAKDLKQGLIKAVGKPSVRFQEDGLRIMRVARFAARFGYAIDPNTFEGMKQNLETLKKVSKERINDELSKTLMSAHASYGLQLLRDSGALDIASPLLEGRQLPLLPHQDRCQGPLEARLAFLYNKIPSNLVNQELFNLKFSNKEIKKTIFFLELVDRFIKFQEKDTALSYKSFMAVVKNHSPDPWNLCLEQFIELSEAMKLGAQELFDKYQNEVVLSRKEMNINGDDLLASGMPAGPRIKKALEGCYLEILKNPENNNKYHLLEVARQF